MALPKSIKLNKGNDNNVKETQTFSLRTTYGSKVFGTQSHIFIYVHKNKKKLKNEKKAAQR